MRGSRKVQRQILQVQRRTRVLISITLPDEYAEQARYSRRIQKVFIHSVVSTVVSTVGIENRVDRETSDFLASSLRSKTSRTRITAIFASSCPAVAANS